MLTIIVRHAESRNNTNEVQHPDSDLSALGREQADRIAARLARQRIAAIYASPYRRAIQTAQPLAGRCGLPIRLRPELCEYYGATRLDLTGFGLPDRTALSAEFAGVVADPDEAEPRAWPRLDEALAECVARQKRLIAQLRARWGAEDDVVVLFGHGLPVARFIEAWMLDEPGPAFRFIMENAALNVLRFAGGVRSMICMNDTRHLAGLAPSRGSGFGADGEILTRTPRDYW